MKSIFLAVAAFAVLISSGCATQQPQQVRYTNAQQSQTTTTSSSRCNVGEKLQRNDELKQEGCYNLVTGERRIISGVSDTTTNRCQVGERLQRNGSQTACYNPQTGTRRIL